jgi:hypothetical protein
VYDGHDHTTEVGASVATGVGDGFDFGKYLFVKSVLRTNSEIITAKGSSEALGDVIFADTYRVYFGINDPNEESGNYDLANIGTAYGEIFIDKFELKFETARSDNKLTIAGAEGYEVKFTVDDGREITGEVGQTEFEVNNYRAYRISGELTGDDRFNYTVKAAESEAYEDFFEAAAANVGETSAAGALGYVIYLIAAALKKAKKAQDGFEKMKTASDARRFAAYRSEVNRIQGTKEANVLIQQHGIGTEPTPQKVVKKPKYPYYPNRIDLDLVPKPVPRGYSPVLKKQTVPKIRDRN